MTTEEKELLLKDLCARLPYNVKVSHDRIPPPGWKIKNTWVDGYLDSVDPNWSKADGYRPHIICAGTECGIADVKPYLRPMSSMTEEEKKEFYEVSGLNCYDGLFTCKKLAKRQSFIGEVLDWLNAHHFDYRGLIEKGLALEAPEGMYSFS